MALSLFSSDRTIGNASTSGSQVIRSYLGNKVADESSCDHRRHATKTHLMCHRESPDLTHHHQSTTQRSNGRGKRKFLPEGRLHVHLQPGRCRSPSPPTIRTHAAAHSVRPLVASDSQPYLPTVQGGVANIGTLAAVMPERRCPPATHL